MRRLKIGLFAAAILVFAGIATLATTNAQGPDDKVVICHTPGHRADFTAAVGQCFSQETKGDPGKVVEIEVSVNACQAHLGRPCNVDQ